MDLFQDDINNKHVLHDAINTSKSDQDEPDELPKDLNISLWEICTLIFAIVTHIVDVGIDYNVAWQYYIGNQLDYFILTIIFIAVPSIINVYTSLKIYDFQDIQRITRTMLKSWLLLPFLLIFQMAPVLRYCDVLRFALKSRRAARMGNYYDQKKYYALMAKEDSYVSLLRIFECFLEAVPQQILQICIVLVVKQKETFTIVHQCVSIASSTISIAWAMASYYKNVRIAYENRKNISYVGTILQFLWHITITISRIVSISLAATVWPISTGIFCLVHWLFMTLCIYWKSRSVTFCMPSNQVQESRIMKFFFSTILGLVYITTYLSPSEGLGKSRNNYIAYYGVFLIENVSAVTVWAITGDDQNEWYYYPLIIGTTISFFVGIMFMLLYYKLYHPHMEKIQIPKPPTMSNSVKIFAEDEN